MHQDSHHTPHRRISTDLSLTSKTKSTSSAQRERDMKNSFPRRHIGPTATERQKMLNALGYEHLDQLIDTAVPAVIRSQNQPKLNPELSESELLEKARSFADENKVFKSFIGMGYYDTHTPTAILRNVLENPGWYTAYTPYQAEISQGRMEALLNFQTMVSDLTGLGISNASLLDEGTAAAEAMTLALNAKGFGKKKGGARHFFVSDKCLPQTIDVLKTRARPLGIELVIDSPENYDFSQPTFGALLQYPDVDGEICDFTDFIAKVHENDGLVVMAADLLCLTLLKPPGELGADIAVGSTQRFGVPMGFGGPHAAYFATHDKYKRQVPGRFIGVSQDSSGRRALRLALQTREQHIRREKATSNICTSQVLLAVIAGFYATYHGPEGLKRIAEDIHEHAQKLARGLQTLGHKVVHDHFFDTLKIELKGLAASTVHQRALALNMNLRMIDDQHVGLSVDETTKNSDLLDLFRAFTVDTENTPELDHVASSTLALSWPTNLQRSSEYLTHPIFSLYHSETEIMRYMQKLQNRDLSLVHSMIPLGSCTMKLNAATEMTPVTWREFGGLHPFAPLDQAEGYLKLVKELEHSLCEITGFDAMSLQPNAGSQGEYAGLLVIRNYHESRGEAHRNICLIPNSAHGTNPASAVMAGLKVVVVACDDQGNIDVEDLKTKATEHKDNLAALMITYPSTHGVFEASIVEICQIIHDNGGQVYMDGANLNALVGIARPGEFGADVSHLNLHKTFCIPHGGGGPGMGPIGVKSHLAPFLPSHSMVPECGPKKDSETSAVSSAPWGSPSILPISWAYIEMMGAEGLKLATETAILNANYIAHRLKEHYGILYTGREDLVAHECIIDVRPFKDHGITVDDIAKRLMDYGFHAPTMSWPVAGTLMIEPTESESLSELDRFCDAMISIRREIQKVIDGGWPGDNNPLHNAPHTAESLTSDEWDRPYSRQEAAYPLGYLRDAKYWPHVGRVDNAFGDKNFMCSCPPLEDYQS